MRLEFEVTREEKRWPTSNKEGLGELFIVVGGFVV